MTGANLKHVCWRGRAVSMLLFALVLLAGCQPRETAQTWELTEIDSFLPDLEFTLQPGAAKTVTAADFHGEVVLLYFGYMHCPDVCPMTLARMGGVLREMGEDASDVRLVFVSVDPARDAPVQLQAYAQAFSPRAIGLTGTPAGIEAMAKRYRVAYQAEAPDSLGNYEVMHAKAVYVFDREGRARLIIDDTDPPEAIIHDLRQLVAEHP